MRWPTIPRLLRLRTCALALGAGSLLLLTACVSKGPLSNLTRTASPHERYLDSLRQSGLDQTALGRDWAAAAEQALQAAVAAASPFRETAYFPPGATTATAYRLDLRRGRRLVVDVTFESVQPGRLFVDLFRTATDAAPRRVASLAADTTTLTYDIEQDATYLLRIQPELLRSGRFTLVERTVSSLLFPVSGLTARAVQSAFGAARDAGAREHEGIDIFAPRGTPVVAVADGVARADTNTLGGNVVWLRDRSGGQTFYYAHLDRWAREGTSSVRVGDVLGYVGNTGNARTTGPHLHFGIYERGAIDPLPFLQPDDPVPPAASAGLDRLGELVRVVPARTPLRQSASRASAAIAQLERASVAQVMGVSQTTYRVVLPDGASGYVEASAVSPVDKALSRQRLTSGTPLRESPLPQAPVVEVLANDTQADVLGRFQQFDLARIQGGQTGWVEVRSAASPRSPAPPVPQRGGRGARGRS